MRWAAVATPPAHSKCTFAGPSPTERSPCDCRSLSTSSWPMAAPDCVVARLPVVITYTGHASLHISFCAKIFTCLCSILDTNAFPKLSVPSSCTVGENAVVSRACSSGSLLKQHTRGQIPYHHPCCEACHASNGSRWRSHPLHQPHPWTQLRQHLKMWCWPGPWMLSSRWTHLQWSWFRKWWHVPFWKCMSLFGIIARVCLSAILCGSSAFEIPFSV